MLLYSKENIKFASILSNQLIKLDRGVIYPPISKKWWELRKNNIKLYTL